ncbi:MAG: M28 family peptidase, partial [Bacillota bacterium]
MSKDIINELKEVLEKICLEYGERLTGSKKNKEIANYAKSYFQKNGYNVELQRFSCIDWKEEGVELYCNGEQLNAKASYYTNPCQLEAEYLALNSIEGLESSELEGRIAVLYGELTVEQLMPKSFSFYNPEHHQKIIRLLEEKNPAAIVTIVQNGTSIFEDGDFDIPSVYVSKELGEKVLNSRGKITLSIKAERIKSSGSNVIARINDDKKNKIVITAHLDTKYGTPGALDNGTGIAILLLLSKLIKADMINYCLELLLLNGEDYYSTPGQMVYLEESIIEDNNIFLAINCDGIGLKDSKTALAVMELEAEKELLVREILGEKENLELIEPWVQGDHMLFVMNQIPVVTLTSKDIFRIIDSVIHTEKDTLDLVDYNRVEEVVFFLEELLSYRFL